MSKDPLKISLLMKLPFQIAFAAAMLHKWEEYDV